MVTGLVLILPPLSLVVLRLDSTQIARQPYWNIEG